MPKPITNSAATKAVFDRQAQAAAARMQKDIDKLFAKFKKLPPKVRESERKKAARIAAEPLVQTARSNVNDSDGPHYRQSKKEGINRRITYWPGNLRKAIKKLSFRKSPSIWVGPKVDKRAGSDNYGQTASKVDAYYAHFVEYGTRLDQKHRSRAYMRRAYDARRLEVLRILENELTKRIEKWVDENKIR